jgi:hypothetical protein
MRLGFIGETTANAYYRAIIPMRALERRGHSVVWPRNSYDPTIRELFGCELVHCYRRMDRIGDLRKLSRRGVAISFDNDDNYAAAEVSDGGTGLKGHRHNQELSRLILTAVRLADLVTTPSPVLAEQYRAAGAENVIVIENRLERDMFGFGVRSKHDGVVLGWIAGREHRLDLERLSIAATLERLLAAHPQLRILTVGVRLPLQSDRYEHIEAVPFPDLLTTTGRLDIGIAPIADTLFNRSRSNIKLKEYGSGGSLWLASPVGPYRDLGEKQGGMLVPDDDWFPTIHELIEHRRSRKRLAKRALAWATTQTVDHHAEIWEDTFLAAIERAQQRSAPARSTAATG